MGRKAKEEEEGQGSLRVEPHRSSKYLKRTKKKVSSRSSSSSSSHGVCEP